MTANDAITKIRVLLGVEEEPKQVAMASATLVDGTEVSVEGEFEVGKPLFVVTTEGNIAAPAGIHQTTSDLLVTVDESGVITQIEEVTPEAAEEVEEEVKVEMEEVAEDEEKMEEEEVEVEMEGKFQKFSKEPAAKPIKKAEAFTAHKMDAIERIAQIRKSK